MKLSELIEQYLKNDSIKNKRIIEQAIIDLCDKHMTKVYNIHFKYGLDLDDFREHYVPHKGGWKFISVCYDKVSVRLSYDISYGHCGYEGFDTTFSINDIDNFDEGSLEKEVKERRIKILTNKQKSLIEELDKVKQAIENLK